MMVANLQKMKHQTQGSMKLIESIIIDLTCDSIGDLGHVTWNDQKGRAPKGLTKDQFSDWKRRHSTSQPGATDSVSHQLVARLNCVLKLNHQVVCGAGLVTSTVDGENMSEVYRKNSKALREFSRLDMFSTACNDFFHRVSEGKRVSDSNGSVMMEKRRMLHCMLGELENLPSVLIAMTGSAKAWNTSNEKWYDENLQMFEELIQGHGLPYFTLST